MPPKRKGKGRKTPQNNGKNDKEIPENEKETLDDDDEDLPENDKHPASGDIAHEREATSDDDNSDQDQPAEPLRTRGSNHWTDIPKSKITVLPLSVLVTGYPSDLDYYRNFERSLRGAWPTWKKVPQDIKDLMWDTFVKHFKWLSWRQNQIYKAWKKANSNRLRASLCEERKRAETTVKSSDPIKWKGHHPDWIPRRYWNRLIDDFWSTKKWQAKSASGKQNRINGNEKAEPTYTGGSIPSVAHKLQMRKELKRDPTEMELYDRTHKTKGGTGEYVCPKAKRVRETYEKDMEEKYPDSKNRPSFHSSIWNKVSGSLFKKSSWSSKTDNKFNEDDCDRKMNDTEKMVEEVQLKAED